MWDPSFYVVLAGVMLMWLVIAFVVHRWGPGVNKRIVRCPEKHTLARVSILYREAGFGSVRAEDVVKCSLLGPGPVTCDKHCLAHV